MHRRQRGSIEVADTILSVYNFNVYAQLQHLLVLYRNLMNGAPQRRVAHQKLISYRG
jgi:hypothetical protein